MKELIKKLLETNHPKKAEGFKTEFEDVSVYEIETGKFQLNYWNSSNSEPIRNVQSVLKGIAVQLLDNLDAEDELDWVTEGEVDDGWNTILFEVKEK